MRAPAPLMSALLALLLACEPRGNGLPPSNLSPVPHPKLTNLESVVEEQLRAGGKALEAALRSAQAGTLADRDLSRVYLELGRLYHAYAFRDAAEACYERSSTLDPTAFAPHYYLGHLSQRNGHAERAGESFQRALDLSPDHLPTIVYLGRVHFERNHLAEAARVFEYALAKNPHCPPALLGLGKTALARGDAATAVRHLESVKKHSPLSADVNYPLGLAYRELGDFEKAAACLSTRGAQRVVDLMDDPLLEQLDAIATGMRIHNNRGGTFFLQRHYSQAAAEFRQAVAAAPESASARSNLGSALEMLGHRQEARREFEAALTIDPHHVMSNFNLGTILAEEGDDASAIRHYEAALSRDPAHEESHFNLANALRRQDRFAEAYHHYRRVIESDPRHEDARRAAALSLIRLRRYRDAHQLLEESHRAFPESFHLTHLLARLLAACPEAAIRDGERALKLADRAYRAHPSPQHVETMAMAWAETGRFDSAVIWQQQVIEAIRTKPGFESYTATLLEQLDLYRRHTPCRTPWRDTDPMVSPKYLKQRRVAE